MTQPSFVVALIGYPGVGKLTVARALQEITEAEGATTLVVDNHWINNPIFGLVDQDGVSPMPDAVWEQVGVVTGAVFTTLETVTPRAWNVVLTAYLDGKSDGGWLPAVRRIADVRQAVFLPVRLTCSTEENVRRIVDPERRRRMKSVDPEEPIRLAAAGASFDPGGDSITIDVTDTEPSMAARTVLDVVRRRSGEADA